MSALGLIPGGKVLAIASQVVSGYVGNSTTTFVLQLLGLETATLNTVQFSNHSGYRQKTGERTSPRLIRELWAGLKMNGLDDGFSMLLTGYVPGPDELGEVGNIAKEVKEKRKDCFWLLDPVMGDQGRLYVSEGVLPVYKSLLPHADLIVPNQFEAELLSGVKADSLETLSKAISALHDKYNIPHVVVTSITFTNGGETMVCAGSSRTSSGKARKFLHNVPIIDGFFSGTGDLFAALTLARLRQQSAVAGLLEVPSWLPPDNVPTMELPLAKAIGVVLASMHEVLVKTKEARDEKLAAWGEAYEKEEGQKRHIMKTRASELRLVQSQKELLEPKSEYRRADVRVLE